MSNRQLDEQGNVYPSLKGVTGEVISILESSYDFSWYSFKRPIYGPGQNEAEIEAISYDEAGEEEKFYRVKIVVEEI